MKKVFTTLITGGFLLASGTHIKADNTFNNDLQNTSKCKTTQHYHLEGRYSAYTNIAAYTSSNSNKLTSIENLSECDEYAYDAINKNVTDIESLQNTVNNLPAGPQGETGATGQKGDQGLQGIQGETGASGVTAKSGSTTTAVIGDSTRNILEVGTGTNPTQIHQSGINVNGQNLISTDANGVTKLGANSLNFQTVNGKENLWGTDASGNIIPLNISNGSKLLINGRDVEQSIDNVGALSAALTGLPTVPLDSKFTCGVGTGAHGGNFAVSGGCATKVSERLTMNFAGSLIPTSQDYQGTGNDWSGRAGFLFKLGKIDKPTQISLNESKKLKNEVKDLKIQNDQLLARLEKLEKLTLALKLNPDTELISLTK